MKTYAIKTPNDGYLAVQGCTRWFQNTPNGWAAFTNEENARSALRQSIGKIRVLAYQCTIQEIEEVKP